MLNRKPVIREGCASILYKWLTNTSNNTRGEHIPKAEINK